MFTGALTMALSSRCIGSPSPRHGGVWGCGDRQEKSFPSGGSRDITPHEFFFYLGEVKFTSWTF